MYAEHRITFEAVTCYTAVAVAVAAARRSECGGYGVGFGIKQRILLWP
jgi:hypothetical protein